MTRSEFLTALENVKDQFEWVIDANFNIRGWREGQCYCPITALNYAQNAVFTPIDSVDLAWKRLGIDVRDAEVIVCAADGNFEDTFRKQLKSILGFE